MEWDMQIILAFLLLSISRPACAVIANAEPITFNDDGTAVTQMEVPSEFYQDTEHGLFNVISNRQTEDSKLPFVLIKTYNKGSFSDGTLGLFMVTRSSEMHFLKRLQGYGTLRSNIVYYENGMAYFTMAGGTLFSIDDSTQEIQQVKMFTDDPIRWVGEESYLDKFCILQDSMYFVANRTELWKSDGTSEGTIMVEKLNDRISSMSVVNDDYLLLAVGSNQMRASDGSSASFILTAEAEAPRLRGWRQNLVSDNQKALFLDNSGVWVTEGTAETTRRISTHRGLLYRHAALEGSMAMISMAGGYLFLTDGTQDGTRPLNMTSVTQAIEKGIVAYRNLENFGIVSSFQSVVGLLSSYNGRTGFLSTQVDRENASIWTTGGVNTNLVEAQIPYPTAGFAQLSAETIVYRTENEVWVFDWEQEEMKPLVRFDEAYAAKSRIFFALGDGTVLLSLQKTGDGQLEFWTIRRTEPSDDVGASGPTNTEDPETTNEENPKLPDMASAATVPSFGTVVVALLTKMLV